MKNEILKTLTELLLENGVITKEQDVTLESNFQ